MSPTSKHSPPALRDLAVNRRDLLEVMPDKLTIIYDKTHPRYDKRVETKISEEFINSIMEHGILQSVRCRRDGDTYEVTAGRRRVRAALICNQRIKDAGEARPYVLVPVVLAKDSDLKVLQVMVVENEQREDDPPIVKAEKAQRLLDHGMTMDEVANQFGINRGTLRNLLMLLDTSDKIQKMVEEKKLSLSAAAGLSVLPRQQQETVEEEIRSSGHEVTRAAVDVAIENLRARNKESDMSSDGSSVHAAGSSAKAGEEPEAGNSRDDGQAVSGAKDKETTTHPAKRSLVLPPPKGVVQKVRSAYPAGVTVSAVAMLTWVTTGYCTGLPDPTEPANANRTLADYLEDLKSGQVTNPVASTPSADASDESPTEGANIGKSNESSAGPTKPVNAKRSRRHEPALA